MRNVLQQFHRSLNVKLSKLNSIHVMEFLYIGVILIDRSCHLFKTSCTPQNKLCECGLYSSHPVNNADGEHLLFTKQKVKSSPH